MGSEQYNAEKDRIAEEVLELLEMCGIFLVVVETGLILGHAV